METWQLKTYDVWGNAEDGWDVNDVYPGPKIAVEGDPIQAFIDAGELRADWKDTHELDDSHEGIVFINRASDGKPIGELVRGQR